MQCYNIYTSINTIAKRLTEAKPVFDQSELKLCT